MMKKILVDSLPKLKKMIRRLKRLATESDITRRAFAVDTETFVPGDRKKLKNDALIIDRGRIMFISISIGGLCWGIPLDTYNPVFLKTSVVMARLVPIMADKRIRKVMHHANYDVNMFMNHGVYFRNIYCTLIAGHCWNENLPNSLKERCVLIGMRLKRTSSVDFTDMAALVAYACDDAIATWKLYCAYEEGRTTDRFGDMKLTGVRREFFDELEMPLLPHVIRMERRGLKIDRKKLAEIDNKILTEMEVIAAKLYVKNGEPFNLRSRPQIAEFLFDKLGLESKKQTPTGKPCVDKFSLAQMLDESKYVRLLDKYNKLESQRRFTGPKKGLHLYCDDSGRIHCTFSQTAARTNRSSCSNPNLQQMPSKTDTHGIRTCFVPAKGNCFIVSDKDQLELRLMAIWSRDKMLLRAYKRGISVHLQTGALCGLLPKHAARMDLTKEQKDALKQEKGYYISKNANFGLQYEGTGFTLWRQLLLEGIVSTPEDCEEIKHKYFTIYEGVPRFREWLYDRCRKKGYIVDICGRPYVIPNIDSTHDSLRRRAERQCINTTIQASGASVVKFAMLAAFRNKKLRELGYELLLQIHDELIFEGPEKNREKATPIIKKIMEARPPRMIFKDIPIELTASVASGPNWKEAKG